MQVQDYLPFFQDLLAHYIQTTLEDPIYAGCLAIAVWLLTAIFYSFRIGILNRRNRVMLKARIDLQNELTATQQQIQALQDEIGINKEQIEQEVQRTAALQERITELGGQISESIVALAADPELGQQGLTVSKGLEVEHLWQRFSSAVKLLAENLVAERKNKAELEQAVSAETAKLAEKDLQLQATQTRFDLQKQQLAKLEAAAQEHNAQLAQQQEAAAQRLAEVEARHQAELARLAALESQTKHQASSVSKAAEPLIAKQEVVKPVEIKAAPVQTVAVAPEPQAVKVEAKPVLTATAASESAIATKVEPPKAEKTGGVTGKFKNLFAGAKQKMDKLDGKLGVVNDPVLALEETVQAEIEPQSEAVDVPVSAYSNVVDNQAQPEIAVKAATGGMGGKLKNLFGSSKKTEAEPVVESATVEPVVEEVLETGGQSTESKAVAPGKIKSLFGKFKRNS